VPLMEPYNVPVTRDFVEGTAHVLLGLPYRLVCLVAVLAHVAERATSA
jgi:hypothetical protein